MRRARHRASVRVARVLLGEVGEVEIERAQHSHDGRRALGYPAPASSDWQRRHRARRPGLPTTPYHARHTDAINHAHMTNNTTYQLRTPRTFVGHAAIGSSKPTFAPWWGPTLMRRRRRPMSRISVASAIRAIFLTQPTFLIASVSGGFARWISSQGAARSKLAPEPASHLRRVALLPCGTKAAPVPSSLNLSRRVDSLRVALNRATPGRPRSPSGPTATTSTLPASVSRMPWR